MHRITEAPGLPPAPARIAYGAVSGNLVTVSGQGPLDENGNVLSHLSVQDQTAVTLAHVQRVLAAAGAQFSDVMMLRVYLTDRAHFAEMNVAFDKFIAEHCGDTGPARTTVITQLPFEGMVVEIDALAHLPITSEARA